MTFEWYWQQNSKLLREKQYWKRFGIDFDASRIHFKFQKEKAIKLNRVDNYGIWVRHL